MPSDRNLLVGLTALGNGLLGASEFLQACTICRKKSKALMGEVLAEHDWISGSQRTVIENAVERLIETNGGRSGQALVETLRALEMPSIRRIVAHEETLDVPFRTQVDKESDRGHDDTVDHRSESGSGHVLIDTIEYRPESRSRYTLTTVHGKGGLGQVWLAFDQDLNREVALKEIRPDRRKDSDAKRRLITEAQVTGQLEHPNIIPVYELTRGPEGQPPFYTMRFLRGKSLRNAIQEYHRELREGKAGPMQLRVLLNAFVGVCNAVAYAASRGIIHRDLKPDNVMLGAFGEVIVLDWGLARAVDQEEPDDEQREIQITSSSQEPTKTRDGQIVGSPAYMAPEQAQGRLSAIDVRTDVYGLGAILYSILTGHAPHRATDSVGTASDTMEILKKISAQPTPEAVEIAPETPKALNSICAKAMSKKRAERYQTALELSDDVQCWMADEPVSVHLESWSEKLARGTRRHRTWTQAAAIVLVCVALISVVAAVIVNGARRAEANAKGELQTALYEVREAKEEATRRFQETRDTVEDSLVGIVDVLQYFPAVQPLRIKLLERAAADYERFAAERSDDPSLQQQTARAMMRLGDLRGWQLNWQAAVEQYQRAETFLRTLLAEGPENDEYRFEMAHCHASRGFAQFSLGEDEAAEAAYRAALDILEDRPGDAVDITDWRTEEAGTLSRLAELHARTGSTSTALALYLRAKTIFASIVNESNDLSARARLAAVNNLQGQLLRRLGRLEEADKILENAITEYQVLTIRDKDNPVHPQGVAECQLSRANVLSVLGREKEAIDTFRAAMGQFDLLLKTIPDAPRYREGLASTRRQLAQMLLLQGNNSDAYSAAYEALNAFTDLVVEQRGVHEIHVGHGACTLTFGFILRDLNDDVNAKDAANSAFDIFRELAEAAPKVPDYRVNLSISRQFLARVLHKQGQYVDAQEILLEAIEDLEAALQLEEDKSPATQDVLATAYMFLGDAFLKGGETEDAKVSFRESLKIREVLTEQKLHRFNLAWLLTHCQSVELRQPERAVEQAKKLVEQVPDNGRFHSLLGMAQYRVEDFEASLRSLQEANRKRLYEHSTDWFFLAMTQRKKGQEEEALASYQKAVELMDANHPGNINAAQFRAEAEQVLGIQTDGQDGTTKDANHTNEKERGS